MKSLSLLASSSVLLVLSATAAGCAMSQNGHASHHAAGGMDPKAMCEMHRQEMAGKTAAEQQALMQEHLKSMSPEMRQRMQAMHAQCK